MSIIIQISKTPNEMNSDTDSINSISSSYNSSTNPYNISVLSVSTSNKNNNEESSYYSIKTSKDIEREIIINTDKDKLNNNYSNESNGLI